MALYEHDETKRVLNRVRKLLTLGNDSSASEGERDNAMRMAHAILAKYNLDMAQVESASGEAKQASEAAEPRVDHTAEFLGFPWARNICQSIAELFFCHYVYSTKRNSWDCTHYFIGRTSNAVTASLVAEFVVRSTFREATRRMKSEMEGNAFRRSFGWGVASTVRERVRELRQASSQQQAEQPVAATGPGTALVLASIYETEAEANRKFVAQRWGGKLGKGRGGKSAGHSDAVSQGKAYGRTVSLNPQVR